MSSAQKNILHPEARHGSWAGSVKHAFTLVETMVAVAILGLGLFGSFALLVHSYATLRRTDETLYVNRMLESTLEVTRNLSYDELIGHSSPIQFSTDYPVFELYGKAVNPDATADPDYGMELEDGSGQITIEEVSADLSKVTVAISWTPFRLPTSTKSVVTYISRNGINKR